MQGGKKRLLADVDLAMFSAGERVVCAVSGGADSVALLLALTDANAARQSLGVALRAVHVHHGLRGEEADTDEGFVRELCDGLAVPLTVERVDTAARQQIEHEGMEEAARELRYGVFQQLLAGGAADTVATAHTLDDQAETVTMKLLRGAWTEGLSGIAPLVQATAGTAGRVWRSGSGEGWVLAGPLAETGKGRIVRPMLRVRRAEVEGFLRARGQAWREDSSNGDLRFTRNRVRQELMPLLRSFNPSVDEQLGRLAAIARDEESFWAAEVARVLPGLLLPGKPVRGGGRAVGTGVGEGSFALELGRLRSHSPALQRRLLRAAAGRLGVRLGADDTGRLMDLAGTGAKAGARLELPGGVGAERSLRELRLFRAGA